MKIEELVSKIENANYQYRIGSPIMSDSEYDKLVEELERIDPNNPALLKIGLTPQKNAKKEKLIFSMASMTKLKTIEDFFNWLRSKKISNEEMLIIMPKFDGMSLSVNEISANAWTRGDGEYGQRVDEHLKMTQTKFSQKDIHTYGELIFSKEDFKQVKLHTQYKNSRNTISGLIDADTISPILKLAKYIRYGIHGSNLNKDKILQCVNEINEVPCQYHLCKAKHITHELLEKLYLEWSIDYDIDGLIIETNSQLNIPKEKNGNPGHARAYKGFELETAIAECIKIENGISKYGRLCPLGHIKPINLDGITITHVTFVSSEYVLKHGLGPGATFEIVRGGQVIPKHQRTIKRVDVHLPKTCPSCNEPVYFDKNNTYLNCINVLCAERVKSQILAFFKILKAEKIGPGIIDILYNNGYITINSILTISLQKLIPILGPNRSKEIYDNIAAIKENYHDIHTLQLASSLFEGFGNEKLILLNDISLNYIKSNILDSNVSQNISNIKGFSEETSKNFIKTLPIFKQWVIDLNLKIKTKHNIQTSGIYSAYKLCFTGIRDKNIEEIIKNGGGQIVDSVNKCTHLIVNDINSTSNKNQQAKNKNIPIIEYSKINSLLNIKL